MKLVPSVLMIRGLKDLIRKLRRAQDIEVLEARCDTFVKRISELEYDNANLISDNNSLLLDFKNGVPNSSNYIKALEKKCSDMTARISEHENLYASDAKGDMTGRADNDRINQVEEALKRYQKRYMHDQTIIATLYNKIGQLESRDSGNYVAIGTHNVVVSKLETSRAEVSGLRLEINQLKREVSKARELIPDPRDIEFKIFYGEEYLDRFQGARYLGLSSAGFRNVINQEKVYQFTPVGKGYRKVYYLREDLDHVLAKRYALGLSTIELGKETTCVTTIQ